MPDSKVKKIGNDVRPGMVTFNRTNENDEYNASHPDAMGDGDNFGKDDMGSKDDMQARTDNVTKNLYTRNSEYTVDD